MPSPNNLIKVNQLDPEISGYITGLLGANFSSFATLFGNGGGYFGTGVLYVTGGSQFVYGAKTFVIPPNIPYSGGTGQAITKLFVTDRVAEVQAQINAITSGRYATTTGSQTFSGTQTFSFLLNAASGNFSSVCLVPSPASPSGAVNLSYLTSAGIVFNTGNQTIDGSKTFSSEITIPEATEGSSAVSYSQLLALTSDLSNDLGSRMDSIETSTVDGFGGVLSINGHSGRAVIKGCGGISVTQSGGLTRISGNATTETKQATLQQTSLASGIQSKFISFPSAFSIAPVVVGELVADTSSVVGFSLSGVSTTGFNVIFSTPLPSNGYKFSSIASAAQSDSITTWKQTVLTSGQQTQFIPFAQNFISTPIVLGALKIPVGGAINNHVLSGISSSGFYVVFNTPIASTGYAFNSFAGSQTGVVGLTVVAVSGGPEPSSIPVNINFHKDVLETGLALYEEFISKEIIISGWAAGRVEQGSSSDPLSGTVYYRDLSNTKTPLFNFGVNVGSYGRAVSLPSVVVPALSRIGVDIFSGTDDVAGFSMGIFGY